MPTKLQFTPEKTAVFSGENFSKQGCFQFAILYLFIVFMRKDEKKRKKVVVFCRLDCLYKK